MTKKSTLRAEAQMAKFSAIILALSVSAAVFAQSNNGNGQGSGKPPLSLPGLAKLPMWSLSGNAAVSTSILGRLIICP